MECSAFFGLNVGGDGGDVSVEVGGGVCCGGDVSVVVVVVGGDVSVVVAVAVVVC